MVEPILHYHAGKTFADAATAELADLQPSTAAAVLARKLTTVRANRDALHQDFRGPLPYGERQAAEVLKRLADQGVRVIDPAGLAQEWARAGASANGSLAGAAKTIIGRLANHESHRLASGSAKPVYDERDWQERIDAAEDTLRRSHAAYL